MRVRFVCVVAVAMSLLAGWLPAAADVGPSARSAGSSGIQDRVDAIVEAGAPGASLVVRDGSGYDAVSSGVANAATGRPLPADDEFRAGSVTKTFVAVLVLQLVAAGEVALDAPIADYLPNLLPDGDVITVRQLLNHTSGLFNYNEDSNFQDAAFVERVDFKPRQLVAYSTSHPPLFSPGEGWSYANTNYVVLGMLVRKVGDGSLRAQLDQNLFEPLALEDTRFPVYNKHIPGENARGYLGLKRAGRLWDVTAKFSPSWVWAAGSLVSSTPDLAEFYRALLAGELVEPDLLAEMQSTVATGEGFEYGLGLLSMDVGCGVAWGHDGLYVGYYDMVLSSSDGNRQVAVMMNIDPLNGVPPPDAIAAFSDALVDTFCDSAVSGGTELPDLLATPVL